MGYEYMHLDPGLYVKEIPIKCHLPAFRLSTVVKSMVISSVVDVAAGVTATHRGITEPSFPEGMTFTKLNSSAIQREISKRILRLSVDWYGAIIMIPAMQWY